MKEKLLNNGSKQKIVDCEKKTFVKSNCTRAAIAVFYLYAVALDKVGGVTEKFFRGETLPRKRSRTVRLYMHSIP